MNIETALISKIVQTGSIEIALGRGIESSHFAGEDAQTVYQLMVDYARRYKSAPSLDAIRSSIQALERAERRKVNFHFEVASDNLEYLLDKFVGMIKYRATTEALRDLARKTDDEANWANLDLDALEVARHLAMVVPSSQVARLSDVQKRIDEYERRKKEGNLFGIKTGIPTLDSKTMGLQPHELATIAGWLGLGKSTLLQYFLFNAYLQDKTPMMISGEMEASALFRKWDTMATNMSYNALKAMELGVGDMQKWEEWGQKAADSSPAKDIIVIDDIGKLTVDKVYAETIRHNPDLVAVDYIGLMEAPDNIGSGWEKITYCTKALKQNARNLKVPHIVVAQTNREDGGKGAALDRLAGSLSIGRDSDQVYGLYQDDMMREDMKMEVRLLKNRDGGQGDVMLHWEPDTMKFKELLPSASFGRSL